MKKTIYVNDNGIILPYIVDINDDKYDRLVNEIDRVYGMGEMQVSKTEPEQPQFLVSREKVKIVDKVDDSYYYYAFRQSDLSFLLKMFMEEHKTFTTSMYLSTILKKKGLDPSFVKDFIRLLKPHKVMDTIVETDIPRDEKITRLQRLRCIVKGEDVRENYALGRSVLNDLNHRVDGVNKMREQLCTNTGRKFVPLNEREQIDTKKKLLSHAPYRRDLGSQFK